MGVIYFIASVVCIIKTVSYGVWCARNKNVLGAVSLFVLAGLVAVGNFVIM